MEEERRLVASVEGGRMKARSVSVCVCVCVCVAQGKAGKAPVAGFQAGVYKHTVSAHKEFGLPEGARLSQPRTIAVCADKLQVLEGGLWSGCVG